MPLRDRILARLRRRSAAVPRPRGWPITLMLALGFGLIVTIPGMALLLGLATGQEATFSFIRQRGAMTLDAIVERTRGHLHPARAMVEHVARMVQNGEADPDAPEAFATVLKAALAAAPQIGALIFVPESLQAVQVSRQGTGVMTLTRLDLSDSPATARGVAQTRAAEAAYWGELIWNPVTRAPFLNLRMPVRRGGHFLGVLVASVTIAELSRFLEVVDADERTNAFILYGREHVLAHPSLLEGRVPRTAEDPLPRLAEVSDPVLRGIWAPQRERGVDRRLFADGESGRVVEIDGIPWIFVWRQIEGFGDRPWIVGRYSPFAEIESELGRIRQMAILAAAMLLFALLIALQMGRSLTRPIRAIAEEAERVRRLDFDSAQPVPRSVMREVDQAGLAFTDMRAALRWFKTYVPSRLVLRLIERGADVEVESEERLVTVMFTDIVGFTAASENMTAPAVAAFLNEHFTRIGACIEAEDGTIDKFMGDALMAFWNAPDRQDDHADRACRAARAIAATLTDWNRTRQAAGEAPVRLRIGIHTGPVIVGNIGAPGRINFTAVGDAVNIAQRLEQLGREFMTGDTAVVALATAETLAACTGVEGAEQVGAWTLRGREAPVAIFRLV